MESRTQRAKAVATDITRYPFGWLPLTLILLLGAGLYLYQLNQESLWIDELLSINSAKGLDSWQDCWQNIRVVYFLLLRGWMRLGKGDAWLRSLGVLFTLGSVYLTFRLGHRLLNRASGLIAALLVAIAPLFIHHAQEVRMYAASTCFGLLGTLVLTYALEQPKMSLIFGWAIARFVAIITTPLNFFLVLPDLVIFSWKFRHQRHQWLRFAWGLALIAILWLPWIFSLVIKSAKFMGGVKAVGAAVASGQRTSPGFSKVLLQPVRFTAWSFGRANSNFIYWFYNIYALILAYLLGVSLLQSRKIGKLGWVAAWAILPSVPMFAISHISRSLWVDRYLIFTAPYLCLLIAAGWLYVWRRWRLGAFVIASVYAVAVSGGIKRYYTVDDRADWRGMVNAITSQEQSGDAIVWSTGQNLTLALDHYYQGLVPIKEVQIPFPCAAKSNREDMEGWLRNAPTNYSRLWLICSLGSHNLSTFKATIASMFQIKEHQVFPGEQFGKSKELHLFLLQPSVTKQITTNN